MQTMNLAAIDIGTNAVRLLIKQATDNPAVQNKLSKVLMLRVPLRLGFDVFSTGKLGERKTEELLRLMKAYKHLMKIYDVKDYRACATSAMRDAENGNEIISKIAKKTGICIEIIGGDEEAQIVYSNHMECMQDRVGNFIYVDVGGGSTEINVLSDGNLIFRRSYKVGTIRLLQESVSEHVWENMKADFEGFYKTLGKINIIGSGGNINRLYRMAEEKDKTQQRFTVETLQALHDHLRSYTTEERKEKFRLKDDRADVIIPAGEIFLFVAKCLHSEFILVPQIGLSDGILDCLYKKWFDK